MELQITFSYEKKKKLSVTNQSILWTSRDGLTFESQLI